MAVAVGDKAGNNPVEIRNKVGGEIMSKLKKKVMAMVFSAMMILATGIVSLAVEGDPPDVAALVGAGMTDIQSQLMSILGVVIPVLLAVVGVVVAIRFGLKYAKKVGS